MSAATDTTPSDLLSLRAGPLTMTVSPSLGARIIGFILDGKNILLDGHAVFETENANNFGATFWPSPQSAWGWPPIPALDNYPYTARVAEGHLVLESDVGCLLDGSKITLTKTISPIVDTVTPDNSAIDVTYVMKNVGDQPVMLAGWQIARVRSFGLTFFRLGEGGVAADKLATVTDGGVRWYRYDPSVVVAQGQKTFADAKGWLAHVEGDLVFVQAFPDVPSGASAEGEAEVELYADPTHTYVEIEPQSQIATILPGAESEPWTVRWWLRRLPAGIKIEVGSRELVAFVESLITS